jgi:hypothetical protein
MSEETKYGVVVGPEVSIRHVVHEGHDDGQVVSREEVGIGQGGHVVLHHLKREAIIFKASSTSSGYSKPA